MSSVMVAVRHSLQSVAAATILPTAGSSVGDAANLESRDDPAESDHPPE